MLYKDHIYLIAIDKNFSPRVVEKILPSGKTVYYGWTKNWVGEQCSSYNEALEYFYNRLEKWPYDVVTVL